MPFSYEKAKRELQEEQNKLKKQLEKLNSAAYEEHIGYGNHMADDATDAFDQTVDEALKREIKTALEKVNRALAKLKDGTYGLCEDCGGRVDRARLDVLPQALYCLDCQARHENSGARTGPR